MNFILDLFFSKSSPKSKSSECTELKVFSHTCQFLDRIDKKKKELKSVIHMVRLQKEVSEEKHQDRLPHILDYTCDTQLRVTENDLRGSELIYQNMHESQINKSTFASETMHESKINTPTPTLAYENIHESQICTVLFSSDNKVSHQSKLRCELFYLPYLNSKVVHKNNLLISYLISAKSINKSIGEYFDAQKLKYVNPLSLSRKITDLSIRENSPHLKLKSYKIKIKKL
jgi:hypothetical protein